MDAADPLGRFLRDQQNCEITRAHRLISKVLADSSNELTPVASETTGELYVLFADLDLRITSFDRKIAAPFRNSEACQCIAEINGIGPKSATAIGDGAEFRIGGHLAAWIGLAPRQFFSGDWRGMVGIQWARHSVSSGWPMDESLEAFEAWNAMDER